MSSVKGGIMTWVIERVLGGGFLFGSDEIKPLSVLHLFQRDCLLSSHAWSHCRFQEQYQASHNYRSVHHTGSLSVSLSSFRGNDFSGSVLSLRICLLRLVLYSSIICTELSDRIRQGTLKNLQTAIYERPRPLIAGGSADTQPCGLGGDKCLLQRVKDMLDVKASTYVLRDSLVHLLPIVKNMPGQ